MKGEDLGGYPGCKAGGRIKWLSVVQAIREIVAFGQG